MQEAPVSNKTVLSLYNGEVEVEFNAGNHRYKVNGEYKPGVTGILRTLNKPLLIDWSAYMAANAYKELVARNVAEGGKFTDLWLKNAASEAQKAHTKFSDKAKDLGHIVHESIEQFLITGNPVLVPGADGVDIVLANRLLGEFVKWHNANGMAVKGTEQIIYSRKYDYCGTFDVLLENGSKTILADIKTTKRGYMAQKGVYPEYIAQLGAYAIAWEEEHGKEVDDLMIINPDKEFGELCTVSISELGITIDEAKDAFVKTLQIYNAMKPLEYKLKSQNELGKKHWFMWANGKKGALES